MWKWGCKIDSIIFTTSILCRHIHMTFIRNLSLHICPSNSGNWLHLFLKNNLLQVEVLESGSNVMIQCRLLTAITDGVDILWGLVWNRSLPSRSTRDIWQCWSKGRCADNPHFHDLQPCTTYYYNVSLVAVNGNISARVLHSIRIVHTTYLLSNWNCFMY